MPNSNIPYLPGASPSYPGPLARYLPPLPEGAAAAWLRDHLPPGSWILDPFGSSPRLAVEAARAGYRVLVAANNPVMRSLLEMAINQPTDSDLRAALAELAATHKGDERMELHIRSLYDTECAQCGRVVMAECFLWEKQAAAPYARIYHCPHCGDAGERPTTLRDRERAARFASGGLHRARALERVAPLNDPDRANAEEALSVYLPRAIYALFILMNKMDGLQAPPARRKHLATLLLTACDRANTLWPHPTVRERPRQLTIPPRFRENNVWLALEQGIALWASPWAGGGASTSVQGAVWPERLPAQAGICMFEGRLKDLSPGLEEIEIGAVLTTLPRPNQAFWTLSALWSGWLWGRESAGAFKSVLRRRRFDWAWHTAALSAAFESLATMLDPSTPLFALVGEAEPAFLSAALISAASAGFDLEGVALRAESGQAQITWAAGQKQDGKRGRAGTPVQTAGEAGRNFLKKRGQPSAYLPLHTAALCGLAEAGELQMGASALQETSDLPIDPSPSLSFSQVQATLKEAFTFRGGFLRYDGSEQSLDVGQWWLREAVESQKQEMDLIPLADRVEVALVRYLTKHSDCSLLELDRSLCASFPGLLTPDPELIQVCLESYGYQDKPGSGGWRLRTEDSPPVRKDDLQTARRMVKQLGERYGFKVGGSENQPGRESNSKATSSPYLWKDTNDHIHYVFYVIASAVFGEIVLKSRVPHGQSIIVLPGGRANLVAYKLRCNPFLEQEIDKGWRFLKYRHLRWLVENPVISYESFDQQLSMDPLTYTASQMRLL